jgi:surfactin synthase thioesterase subunit
MAFGSLFVKVNGVVSNSKLFFFHHAGGSSAQYLPIFRQIEMSAEVYLLNLPGRSLESKDKAYSDFSILMKDIQQALVFSPNDQVFLLGHSMGALIVYELVRHFETHDPGRLVSFGISSLKPPSLRFRTNKVSHLEDSEFIKAVEEIQPLPAPLKKQKEVLNLVLQTLRNDFKIIESFPAVELHFSNASSGFLFGGSMDSFVSEDDLAEWFERLQFLQGPELFSGDHFYIFQHLRSLLQLLDLNTNCLMSKS